MADPAGALGVLLTAGTVALGVVAPALAPWGAFEIAGPSLSAPSLAHPLGTDALGRDLLSGILHGSRTSLLVALSVGAISFVIGVAIGTTSGYLGGLADDLLMRITELFQVLPRFFLAIVTIALFGPGLDRVILVLGLTSWVGLARVVRAEVFSLRERDFVLAAHAMGASRRRIVARELLPNALPSALVVLGLLIGHAILIEASLGFLGLGDPNRMSWGFLAGEAQAFLRAAWWMALFPGLALTLAVLGFNLLGDALTDLLGGRK